MRLLRLIPCFTYLLLAVLTLSVPLAQAGESLINSEVDVDVTAGDTAAAREQALEKGQSEALADLLGRFATGDQAHQIITNMEPKKIAAMVRGTEVLTEKMSSNRYRATLRVSFDADEISKLISSNGGDAAALQATPIGSFLVLPSYEEDSTALLWDDGNPWKNAWKTTAIEAQSGDVVVPYGDNADSAVVDTKSLASATYSSLMPLTVRYGVTDIIILQAKFTHGADNMVLEVVKRRISRTQNEVNVLSYRADPQETRETLMLRAAKDIVDTLERKKNEEMETSKSVHGGERNKVMMLASISTLGSWTQLRAKLSALPMVDKLEPLAISPQQVDFVLHYRGSPESLSNAITAMNIRLVQNPNYWVISRE